MTDDAKGALRVLVVDDDELDRLAVRRCLRQSGIAAQADEASSAAEALKRAAGAAYDFILLDYYLPGEDGLATLRQFNESVPGSPVVIFTGRGDEDIAVELMKSGAADYLPKASLTPERLGSAIRHALQVREAAAARQRAENLLRLLSEAAEHVLTAGGPDELVRGLWEKIREPLGVDAYFNLMADRAGRLQLGLSAGVTEDAVASMISLTCDAPSGTETAVTARKPVHLTGIQQSDDPLTQSLKSGGIRACSCHPLLGDGISLGTLCFASRTKDRFTDDELDFLQTVSHYATSAYQRLQHIQQMRDSDRRKDEFLATLAHELRDPLAPLSNALELLKRADGDSELLARVRETMERQLGQLVQLVDDLLDMSRITRSRLELRKRRVDLASVLQQAVEMVRPLTEAASQELHVSLPDEQIWLAADPVRLAQVIGNLLTNASKFSEPGRDIFLTAEQGQHGEAVVRVKDSGIGIPTDELSSIFGMFTQVSSTRERSQGGLGIGLTLVHRLVEMHGGSVEARSEGPGTGSEFVIRLPLPDNASLVEAPVQDENSTGITNRRVLIVDDNKDSATSLAMLLQITGNTTSEAYDGLDAVAAAASFRPDVVLLDIGLPNLDGYEVCRRIRAQSWGRNMLIVALSGWGQDKDRRKSQAAGFDHHMIKPVDYGLLVKVLSELERSPRVARNTG